MIVGVDIGGTFTDVVCIDDAAGEIYLTKVITDHANIVESVINGATKLLSLLHRKPAAVERMVLGTTLATNIVVQRAGAKLAIFTTQGFEDVLEIGRLKRRSMYDLDIDAQTPVFLSPKRYRVGVPERLDAAGKVVKPLDETFIARAITEMRTKHAIEAVAVVYLFSFENDAHEVRTREIIHSLYPDLFVSLSSEVNPIYREYERTAVTAFDAYMRPAVERAFARMEQRLRDYGIGADIHIMQSRGGVTTSRTAASRPVHLFLSGPAGGAVGGARLAQAAGCEDAVTIDIGGTSCDVALILGGAPAVSGAGEIAGYPVRVPMVDINTIGAGGGSLLQVNASGVMRVGPESAGSDPGPVCYGRGGREPTITDASLLLGYLNPSGFAGGDLGLDFESARRALKNTAAQMGLSAVEAALGAHRIMHVQMAEQIRLTTVKRGYDPRQLTLIAFGGAGPLHAGALLSMLGMKACLIPPTAGVLSAYGLLTADIEVERGRSHLRWIDHMDVEELARAFADLRVECEANMRREGLDAGTLRARYSADLRYAGQSYELIVPLSSETIDEATVGALVNDFERQYLRMYGHTNKTEVEMVNIRCVSYVPVKARDGLRIQALEAGAGAVAAERETWFLGLDRAVPSEVLRRECLAPGAEVAGPTIIEQADTTILVYPGQTARVDALNHLTLSGTAEAYTL